MGPAAMRQRAGSDWDSRSSCRQEVVVVLVDGRRPVRDRLRHSGEERFALLVRVWLNSILCLKRGGWYGITYHQQQGGAEVSPPLATRSASRPRFHVSSGVDWEGKVEQRISGPRTACATREASVWLVQHQPQVVPPSFSRHWICFCDSSHQVYENDSPSLGNPSRLINLRPLERNRTLFGRLL